MKQKNIAIIVAVAIVSAILSFALATFLFGGKKIYNLKAPTVEPISAEFKLPSDQYFNNQSLDPTKNITIGDSTNDKPFIKPQ